MGRALLVLVVSAGALQPSRAAAYDQQLTLDFAGGWGLAPALSAPNNGPNAVLGTSIGLDDTWGLGIYAGWAVHPPFLGGQTLQIGVVGFEGLYYIDILQVVPFFGVGIDVLPSYDGTANRWGADFAAHLRASIDYLVSREVIIGVDIRPYVLWTALSTDPVYITFLLRLSYVIDY